MCDVVWFLKSYHILYLQRKQWEWGDGFFSIALLFYRSLYNFSLSKRSFCIARTVVHACDPRLQHHCNQNTSQYHPTDCVLTSCITLIKMEPRINSGWASQFPFNCSLLYNFELLVLPLSKTIFISDLFLEPWCPRAFLLHYINCCNALPLNHRLIGFLCHGKLCMGCSKSCYM